MWKRIAVLLSVLIAAGCQSTNVDTDYDTGANFDQFHRYQWLDEKDNIDSQYQPFLGDRVKLAIDDQLANQFDKAPEGQKPDFLVRYYVRPVQKVVDDRPQMGVGVGSYGGNFGTGFSMTFPIGGNRFDQQADIIVDFLDPASHKLAWRGIRTVSLSSSQPQLNDQQVGKAVAEILRQFPPH